MSLLPRISFTLNESIRSKPVEEKSWGERQEEHRGQGEPCVSVEVSRGTVQIDFGEKTNDKVRTCRAPSPIPGKVQEKGTSGSSKELEHVLAAWPVFGKPLQEYLEGSAGRVVI